MKHISYDGVEWNKLTHPTVKWTALVNVVILLRVLERMIKQRDEPSDSEVKNKFSTTSNLLRKIQKKEFIEAERLYYKYMGVIMCVL